MNTNKTLPNLPFSITEITDCNGLRLRYFGLTTTGSYIFFDAVTGSAYRYNINSGYLRRNSSQTMDGRNTLVTKHRVQPDELLEALQHYVPMYRERIYNQRMKNRRHYA